MDSSIFGSICRCCRVKNGIRVLMKSSLNVSGKNCEIDQMYLYCTNLKAEADVQLPHHICYKCLRELTLAYNFKKKCENTHTYFMNYLQNNIKSIDHNYAAINKSFVVHNNDVLQLDEKLSTDSTNIPFTVNNKESTVDIAECSKNNVKDKVIKKIKNIVSDINKSEIDSAKAYVCHICKVVLAHRNSLTHHMKIHYGIKDKKCPICGRAFLTNTHLKVHILSHKGVKNYECPSCKKRFSTKYCLNSHQRSHTGEKPFLCSSCGKGFGQSGNLQNHMRTHSGEKPLKCQVCDKPFATYNGLTVHLRTHTGEKPYKCKHCGKCFSVSSALRVHARTHTGEKPYPCNLCDKSFRTQSLRAVHRRAHTGEKPAVCNICRKGFSTKGHLREHQKSHDKKFACKLCDGKFCTEKDLIIHETIHNGNKEHVCPTCGEKFNRKNNLNKHIKIVHVGVKDYICQTCDRAFGTSTQLNVHIRSHTGQRPYDCLHCDKAFKSSGGLSRHTKTCHINHIKENTREKNEIENDEML